MHRRDRLLSTVAWLHLALLAVMLLAMPFDSRTVMGLSPWIKPAKFAVSIAIYLWTVAWLLHHVRDARIAASVISRGSCWP